VLRRQGRPRGAPFARWKAEHIDTSAAELSYAWNTELVLTVVVSLLDLGSDLYYTTTAEFAHSVLFWMSVMALSSPLLWAGAEREPGAAEQAEGHVHAGWSIVGDSHRVQGAHVWPPRAGLGRGAAAVRRPPAPAGSPLRRDDGSRARARALA